MTHTVGPKGQVVIPKALRDQFGIEPGDKVNFWYCDDHLALRPVRPAVESEPLRGRYKGSRLFDDRARPSRRCHGGTSHRTSGTCGRSNQG